MEMAGLPAGWLWSLQQLESLGSDGHGPPWMRLDSRLVTLARPATVSVRHGQSYRLEISEMTADDWVAIGDRHIWYKQLLRDRLARCPTAEADTLAYRMERHRERMERHLLRALAQDLVEGCDTRH